MTEAVERRERMKVEFEEGLHRLANLQAEAQNPPAPVPPVMEMEAEILREHVAELEGTGVAEERLRVRQRVSTSSGVGFIPSMPTLVPGELHVVGGSTDRSPRGIDLRTHVTCVGVDIQDDRRSRTFEGDHFKCSHGALIEVARHGSRGDVSRIVLAFGERQVRFLRSASRRGVAPRTSFVASVAQWTESGCPCREF